MFFILHKLDYLKERPRKRQESREPTNDEARDPLHGNGFRVVERKGRRITCDGNRTAYSAPASPKKAGWQITVRDDHMRMLVSGDDGLHILLQRTEPYIIPSTFLRRFIPDSRGENTVDLYIDGQHDLLKCGRQNDIGIGKYRIPWPSKEQS